MENQERRKTNSSGHEGHGVHVCHKCGWVFPNPHPSAKNRRAHKRICGTIEGYKLSNSGEKTTHLDGSGDEHPEEDEQKTPTPSPKVVETSASQRNGSGIISRSIKLDDDEFANAAAEFGDSPGADVTKEPFNVLQKTSEENASAEKLDGQTKCRIWGEKKDTLCSMSSSVDDTQQPIALHLTSKNHMAETNINSQDYISGSSMASAELDVNVKGIEQIAESSMPDNKVVIPSNNISEHETMSSEAAPEAYETVLVSKKVSGETSDSVSADIVIDITRDGLEKPPCDCSAGIDSVAETVSIQSSNVVESGNAEVYGPTHMDDDSRDKMNEEDGKTMSPDGFSGHVLPIEYTEALEADKILNESESVRDQDGGRCLEQKHAVLCESSSENVVPLTGETLELDHQPVAGNFHDETGLGLGVELETETEHILPMDQKISLLVDGDARESENTDVPDVDSNGQEVKCGYGECSVAIDARKLSENEQIPVERFSNYVTLMNVLENHSRPMNLVHSFEESICPVDTCDVPNNVSNDDAILDPTPNIVGTRANEVQGDAIYSTELVHDASLQGEGDSSGDQPGAVSAIDLLADSSCQTDSLKANWGSNSVVTPSDDPHIEPEAGSEAQREESDFFEPPKVMETQASDASAIQPVAKMTNRSASKHQHTALKSLLGEAQSPEEKDGVPVSKDLSPGEKENINLGSKKPSTAEARKEAVVKEWNSPAMYPSSIKSEKDKAKPRPYWAPFICCSSAHSS
ncbi:hypothetical protein Dimus_029820 [Dionaea muscipula]